MFIPKFIVYTAALLVAFYIFSYTRDRRHERKIKGEMSWLRLKVEYMTDPTAFKAREKREILKHHRLLKKVYKDFSVAEIGDDLMKLGFPTTYAYANVMNVEYSEEDEVNHNI